MFQKEPINPTPEASFYREDFLVVLNYNQNIVIFAKVKVRSNLLFQDIYHKGIHVMKSRKPSPGNYVE